MISTVSGGMIPLRDTSSKFLALCPLSEDIMQVTYDCGKCVVSVTFESTHQRAIGNASSEDCQCPTCGAVLGTIRDDWGSPKVVAVKPTDEIDEVPDETGATD